MFRVLIVHLALSFFLYSVAQSLPSWAQEISDSFLPSLKVDLSPQGQDVFFEICQTAKCGVMTHVKPQFAYLGSFSSADAKEALVGVRYGDADFVGFIYNLFRLDERNQWQYISTVDLQGGDCITFKSVSNRTLLICEDKINQPSDSFFYMYYSATHYQIQVFDAVRSLGSAYSLFSFATNDQNVFCDDLQKDNAYFFNFSSSSFDVENQQLGIWFDELRLSKNTCFFSSDGDHYYLKRDQIPVRHKLIWNFDPNSSEFTPTPETVTILERLDSLGQLGAANFTVR